MFFSHSAPLPVLSISGKWIEGLFTRIDGIFGLLLVHGVSIFTR